VGLGVLLEHWSSGEGPVRQRVLRYAVHLGDAGRLLLVVVLYHGERPWTGVDPWDAVLAGLDPEAARAIAEAQARVVLFVDDLTRYSEPELRRTLLTALAQLTHLCLRFLRHATVDQAFAAIDRWGDLLRAVDRDTGEGSGVEAIERISCYFLRVTEIPPGVLHAAFERILQRPENTIMSTAEKLLKEGEARSAAKHLLQLLVKRFGALPNTTLERVKRARCPISTAGSSAHSTRRRSTTCSPWNGRPAASQAGAAAAASPVTDRKYSSRLLPSDSARGAMPRSSSERTTAITTSSADSSAGTDSCSR